jgi:hypothetical protein
MKVRSSFVPPALAVVLVACSADEIVIFRVGNGPASFAGHSGEILRATTDSGLPPVESGGRANATGGAGSAGSGGRAASGGAGGSRIASGGGVSSGGAGAIAGAGGIGMGGSSGGASGGARTGDAGPGSACSVDTDCPSGWTCSKVDCTTPFGLCEPRPILCDFTPAPVCGCDHVTYWNDCIRRQNGVAASTFGQCAAGALACTTAADCGVAGAFCSHVSPTPIPCGPVAPGTCWVTPIDCSNAPPTPLWMPCQGPSPSPPFGTPPTACVDTCTAIRTGNVYVPVPLGVSCP